jgi:glucosyl-dolichyl phosphate glucuronosyltransferase
MTNSADSSAGAPESLPRARADRAQPPSATTAQASVIICAYTLERWDDLREAVHSALSQTVAPLEVCVVVDNNPELLQRAREQLDGVRVAPNHHGPGLSGARNTGADVASGSVLVFLDDDGVASPRWLQEHLSGYADPNVLGVGGEVLPLWRAQRPGWLPEELYWVVGCTYAGMPADEGSIRNPIGANMSIRADVFAGAGGFQHELGRLDVGGRAITGTADETEFCIRASRTYPDGRWMYRPTARIQHVVPAQRVTWRHFVSRCRLEGGSKAVLVGLAGQSDGLASERTYATTVLPGAVVRELSRAARREPYAVRRAGAICAGLAITAWTYLRARAALTLGRGRRYAS